MITATVLTKNSERTLALTLDSLASFSEVILLDTGSTDTTLDIAAQFPNVVVHTSPFIGFGPLHNLASSLASSDWILSVDSDETVSPELLKEIHTLPLKANTLYRIPRHNFLFGKHIKGCGGWHPDLVLRLYSRKATQFSDDQVHEKLLPNNLTIRELKNPLFHTPYHEISDFLSKMNHYSSLFAAQNQGRPSSLFRALLHGWGAFLKSYLLKRGVFQGREGFIISLYNAHTTYYKYLKLLKTN